MKKAILVFFSFIFCAFVNAQLIAKVEMKEKIEGICDQDNVYGLFGGFEGQVEPKCSLSKEEMEKKLNEVPFLKDNPKYKGKGMVGVFINCKGETLVWDTSQKINEELDKQLLEIFKSFDKWTPGTLNGKNVDCRELISYKIKKGVLTLQ